MDTQLFQRVFLAYALRMSIALALFSGIVALCAAFVLECGAADRLGRGACVCIADHQ